MITDARHDSTANAYHSTVPCLSGRYVFLHCVPLQVATRYDISTCSTHRVVGVSTISWSEHTYLYNARWNHFTHIIHCSLCLLSFYRYLRSCQNPTCRSFSVFQKASISSKSILVISWVWSTRSSKKGWWIGNNARSKETIRSVTLHLLITAPI